MIERIRKRFIYSTIASVLVALLLIMGAFNFMSFRSMRVNADLLLNLMAENGGDFPDQIPDQYKGIIEDFSNVTSFMRDEDDFNDDDRDDGLFPWIRTAASSAPMITARPTGTVPFPQ